MKKTVLFLSLLCLFTSCFLFKNDELNTLPLASQVGAGTLGCFINDHLFADTHKGYLESNYVMNGSSSLFELVAKDNRFYGSDLPRRMKLVVFRNKIIEGKTYILDFSINGEAYAECSFGTIGNAGLGRTESEFLGELTITRFDSIKKIVSGNFWFDVKNPINGELVRIREGRFDGVYNR